MLVISRVSYRQLMEGIKKKQILSSASLGDYNQLLCG